MPLKRRLLLILLLITAPALQALEVPPAELQQHYQAPLQDEGSLLPGSRLAVSSSRQEGEGAAVVTGVLPYPYAAVGRMLNEPAQWCDILTLHFNVKACTLEGEKALTLYSGRKFFQRPAQTYPLRYRIALRQHDSRNTLLQLQAEEGPVGSRDYRLRLEALPVAEGTLIRLRSSYRPSLLSQALTDGYLATLGRGKVGFSKNGVGVNGVIERNAMRYFLALQAHLAVQSLAPGQRYEAALHRWFELTERYPAQLHEMEEGEYLEMKRRERLEQQRLQQALAAS